MTSEAFGPIVQWDFANGQQVIRNYDLSGRMSSHSLGSIGYDTTSLSHGSRSFLGGSKTYGYDPLGCLTGYSGSGVSIGFCFCAPRRKLSSGGCLWLSWKLRRKPAYFVAVEMDHIM